MEGETDEAQRQKQKERLERFQHPQRRYPGAAETHGHQEQGPEAAGGSAKRGDEAAKQRRSMSGRRVHNRENTSRTAVRSQARLAAHLPAPEFTPVKLHLHPQRRNFQSRPESTGLQLVRNYGVTSMPNGVMTIGQVAGKADVHIETIRYYQRIGLVSEPVRPPGGIRHYDDNAVARLRFIRRSQQLGFSLDEVRNLLALEDGLNCRDTRLLAEKKLEVFASRLADLRRMQKQLRKLIAECESGKRPRACPIIAALSA